MDDQNASAKALQAAEGTWRSDEASLRAAQGSLSLNRNMVRQSWGDVISSWVFDGSPAFDHLATQRDVLLQVALPAGSSNFAAQTGVLQLPDGKLASAKLVSAIPRVDPRIQSPTYLYVTVSRPDLIPGMNLVFLLPSGPPMRGVLVPSSAVVWWQGKAWAYRQIAPDRFSRREVPTNVPANGGWFVTKDFSPGDRIVIAGGQQLLSEEFRSQIQVLGEEGEKQ
jgi:multidrug efflux pump subunit AcrA (membrane-fusion protein)